MGVNLKVYFDVLELYYLPQYFPVAKELSALGFECTYVFYENLERKDQQLQVIKDHALDALWVPNVEQAKKLYMDHKPEWVIIGNYFEGLDEIHQYSKTGLLSHGIGPKACYYTVSDAKPTVRFVEGPYRTQRLQELYPDQRFVDTGYAKLDAAFSSEMGKLNPSNFGLDNRKKTILYAPTFYPSSIECFAKKFPHEFSDYNIILKPHYFSLVSDKYYKQKNMLESWAKAENVYLARENEVNILPFMAVSDVLISDASSTLFEFAALGKPVVWCDFYKLRWSYRGIFKYRFKDRMDEDLYRYADIAVHAKSYNELPALVHSQIQNPDEFRAQRQRHTLALAGVVDGKVSKRIAQYMHQSMQG